MPLGDANVVLVTHERHGATETPRRQDYLTDQDGKVAIDRQRTWHVQILLPDGDWGYSWSLCVSKAGHRAEVIQQPDFEQAVHISLPASDVTSVCSLTQPHGPLEVVDSEMIAVE